MRNSKIKASLLELISQTVEEIREYDALYSRYSKAKAGWTGDAADRLAELGDEIEDLDIPDTEAVFEEYGTVCMDLLFIRDSIGEGKKGGADADVDAFDYDISMLFKATLQKSKSVRNPDLRKPYTGTEETETGDIDADRADGLTAGLALCKALDQTDRIIKEMYQTAGSGSFSNPAEDPLIRDLKAEARKLQSQVTADSPVPEMLVYLDHMKTISDRIKERKSAIEAYRQEMASYAASCREVASYMEALRASYVPLSGKCRPKLKKFQKYLKGIENDINSCRPEKLFSGREDDVAVKSISDVMRLYLSALNAQDTETADIIKKALA